MRITGLLDSANLYEFQPTFPEMGRVKIATALFGVSRSWLYRRAPANPGLLRKNGKSTLVDFMVLRGILRALPVADIRQGTGRARLKGA
jgi:hypothetical protein